MTYSIGQIVQVRLPGGWKIGKVHKVCNWYHGGIRYEVHGKDFITITSDYSMK